MNPFFFSAHFSRKSELRCFMWFVSMFFYYKNKNFASNQFELIRHISWRVYIRKIFSILRYLKYSQCQKDDIFCIWRQNSACHSSCEYFFIFALLCFLYSPNVGLLCNFIWYSLFDGQSIFATSNTCVCFPFLFHLFIYLL